MTIEDTPETRARLSERGGLYLATVTDNNDPEQRGRLRLRIQSVLPNDAHPIWAQPFGVSCGRSAEEFISPEIGDLVCVMFLEGSANVPMWTYGPYQPIRDANGGTMPGRVPQEARSTPGQLHNAYPRRKVLRKTNKGLVATEDEMGEIDVVTNSRPIRVKTKGARIELDARDASGGEILLNRGEAEQKAARKGDGVSVGSFSVTIGAGSITAVIWTPPGGGVPVTLTPVGTEITGKITEGSASVKIGD